MISESELAVLLTELDRLEMENTVLRSKIPPSRDPPHKGPIPPGYSIGNAGQLYASDPEIVYELIRLGNCGEL
ncbi:hypothetical protein ACFZ8E_07390 [Methylobacterium sp. HMF5984]|uniref:hypothetical protein n=1 Tax=Methylobacterium sp. HMF5984 TaxID=3367370 RepID=UPI003854184F